MKRQWVVMALLVILGVRDIGTGEAAHVAPAGVAAVYHTMMGRSLPCLALEPRFVPVVNGLDGPQTVIPSGVSNFTTTRQLVDGAVLSDLIQRRCKQAMPLRAPRANGDSRPIPGLYKLPQSTPLQADPHRLEIALNAYAHEAGVLSTGLFRGPNISPIMTIPAVHTQLKITLRAYSRARIALRAFRLYWGLS